MVQHDIPVAQGDRRVAAGDDGLPGVGLAHVHDGSDCFGLFQTGVERETKRRRTGERVREAHTNQTETIEEGRHTEERAAVYRGRARK